MDNLNFCDDDGGRLDFCRKVEDLIFCDPPELSITGTETPTGTSNVYAAAGGVAPYSWSVTKGSITSESGINNQNAYLDTTGACGSGTITVTDSAGQSASIELRFPTGAWGPTKQLYDSVGACTGILFTTCTIYEGKYRISYSAYCIPSNAEGCTNPGCPCCPSCPDGYFRGSIYVQRNEWICP